MRLANTHKHGSEPAENIGPLPIWSTVHQRSILWKLVWVQKTSVFPVTWDKEPESGRQSESADDNSSNKHEDRDVWCQSAVWTQQLVLPRPYPWRHDWKPSERMRSSTEAIINIATFTLQYIIHYCLVICSIPMLFIWLTSDSKWTLLQKD